MTLVRVVLSGVMLYVPTTRPKKITALIPKTDKKHFGRRIHGHAVSLVVYDKTDNPPTYNLEKNLHIPFKDAPANADITMPDVLPSIKKFSGDIDKDLLKPGNLSGKVHKRIHLWQGKFGQQLPGHQFIFDDDDVRLTNMVFWQYEVDGDSVVIDTADGKVTIGKLPGEQDIVFGVRHIPDEDHDHTGKRCGEASHFHSLYSFFDDPDVEIPRHHPMQCDQCLGHSGGDHGGHVTTLNIAPSFIQAMRSDPVTCVGGGGEG